MLLLVSDGAIQEAQKALWKCDASGGGAGRRSRLRGAIVATLPAAGQESELGVLICGGNTTAVDFKM